MKNNFDLEKMQELWNRQSQQLEGRQLISDEEIAAAITPRHSWLPKAAAVAALLLMAGGAALWLSQTQQEPATEVTAMLTPSPQPTPITFEDATPQPQADEGTPIVRKAHADAKRQPLLPSEPVTIEEEPAIEVMPEAAVSSDLVCQNLQPTDMVETNRLVTFGERKPQKAVLVEGHNLVSTSPIPSDLHPFMARHEEEPEATPEHPTFRNSVIEPLLACIL